MHHKPSYKNIHNRFLLNGSHYDLTIYSRWPIPLLKKGRAKGLLGFPDGLIRPNPTITLKTSGSTEY